MEESGTRRIRARILREAVILALNITQAEFARTLGVSRRTVNEILQEKRAVTVDSAHRLVRTGHLSRRVAGALAER